MDPSICPHCGAARILGPECPRCGVIYLKALARSAPISSIPEPDPPAPAQDETAGWQGDLEDARLEFKIRAIALPVALVCAALVTQLSMPHALMRIFLSMWIHELGHAVTAWFCGFFALPGPWFTHVAESRSWLVSILLAGSIGFGGYRAWLARHWTGAALAIGLLIVQLFMTLGMRAGRAQALILFGGDAGSMVLGSCLIATLYARAESAIHRGWLRWGFLVIGASSFADSFETWWGARKDSERILFGMNEGVGLSDPTRLVDNYGWSEEQLVRRYVVLGIGCLVFLAALYLIKLWQARTAATSQRQSAPHS